LGGAAYNFDDKVTSNITLKAVYKATVKFEVSPSN
jgi:hypothetical protein